MNNNTSEFDFALVIAGVPDLTQQVQDALFESGCDDATFSIQYGNLYAEFSRTASTLQEAILSAIHDVRNANIGAEVVCVDKCDLVTQSEIARRTNRSRQMIHQYITGERGPGNFPPPECYLSDDDVPLWRWCAVSYWLANNNLIRREEGWNAAVVAAINNWLERERQKARNPELIKEIAAAL
ncbi:MAG TPA: helix-turn-helix transcriptional regulator [Tepidisphaeraceae bacterium]|nr:helix-turn-helix transcriptional regulator [Tepidisphaeraceae bacterium]